ncbi:MAG: TIGR04551 family protein [Proteobacteria bacterium]|nr:TIGR04551 family protein [Pseudomonadota bacterium]
MSAKQFFSQILALVFLTAGVSLLAQTPDAAPPDDDDAEAAPTDATPDGDNDDSDVDNDGDLDDEDVDEDDGDDDGDDDALVLDFGALGEDPASGLTVTSAEIVEQHKEEWINRNLEIFELHGYFRVRPELYSKFYIRNDRALYPLNAPQYTGCGPKTKRCGNNLAGANMRFRFAPTINVSEEVRVHAQIDFLDNVMLGSSPRLHSRFAGGETISPESTYGYNQDARGALINVRRVWGEVNTPLATFRFGRMPSHFGLGMLYHSGDGLDADFGDSVDRLSMAFKLNDWLIMPAFDFPNEGLSLDSATGRPFDVSQVDDAYRLVAIIAYQHEREDEIAILKRGDWLINAGLHFSWQKQKKQMWWTQPSDDDYDAGIDNQISAHKRNMWSIVPDFWLQLLYRTFRMELELAFQFGKIETPEQPGFDEARSLDIVGWGSALHIDHGLLSDQLRIGVKFGIASGDREVDGVHAPASFDQANGNSGRYSLFSFNPGYDVDYILYRHILGSVAGTYFFKPWLRYDFLKTTLGKQLGAQLDVVYARAFFKESTISKSNGNLGIEVDATVEFSTADNFYTALKYGILFPMGGFKGDHTGLNENGELTTYRDTDLTIPQTLQFLMGITF